MDRRWGRDCARNPSAISNNTNPNNQVESECKVVFGSDCWPVNKEEGMKSATLSRSLIMLNVYIHSIVA